MTGRAAKSKVKPNVSPEAQHRHVDVPLPKWARVYLVDEYVLSLFSGICVTDAFIQFVETFFLNCADKPTDFQKKKFTSMRLNFLSEREKLRIDMQKRILDMRGELLKTCPDKLREAERAN